MNVLVLAPHQDDEIISCFHLINILRKRNHNIDILFATNGNYKDNTLAIKRYRESLKALKQCQVSSNHLHYLGYEDTGMTLEHSFLWKLYCNKHIKKSPFTNHTTTWHPLNKGTIHFQKTGKEAEFSKDNFKSDLKYAILQFNPSIIIMPSVCDCHGDHKALALFTRELLSDLRFSAKILCYLVHTQNEDIWPNRKKDTYTKPLDIPFKIWQQRKIISVSEKKSLYKMSAILEFTSQMMFNDDKFLLSFAKKEEFFLPF